MTNILKIDIPEGPSSWEYFYSKIRIKNINLLYVDKTNEQRKFEAEKAEVKLKALHAWKSGEKITAIAKNLQRSRETIYRWVNQSQKNLSAKSKRHRHQIDKSTQWKIIEAYILLGKPSVRVLMECINELYGIRLSSSQVRRSLKRWGLDSYQPSSFASILIERRTKS